MTLQQLKYLVAIAENKSIHKAAGKLFVSQPSLSSAVKELENELGIEIFMRSNRGIELTPEGEDFMGYARQIVEQYGLIEERYIKKAIKKKFSVSMQHYTFAVQAFIHMAKQFNMDDYEFAIHETKTREVIENVKRHKSELGIIYLNTFNEKALKKILKEDELEFIPLFDCGIYVYLWKGHPLAERERVNFEDLQEYPCLSFEQGMDSSFYFSEEVFSTYDFKQTIKVDDRSTMLNLMVGLNGYTLCSGIICEDLNGTQYRAVPLDSEEIMTIGYIKNRKWILSDLGERYIEELKKYKKNIMR